MGYSSNDEEHCEILKRSLVGKVSFHLRAASSFLSLLLKYLNLERALESLARVSSTRIYIYIYIYAERETDSRLDPFVECFRCKITRILVCSPQSIEPCKQMTIIVFKKCMMDVMIGWCTKPDTVED